MSSTVPPLPWNAAQPSSNVVQHAFVNARCSEINRGGSDLKARTIKALREDTMLAPRIKGYSSSKKDAFCEDAYNRLTRILQSRDLTINFKAASWFSTENTYETYAQMYERGLHGGRMLLNDSDPLNPANTRVGADDRVTFPTQWANAPGAVNRGLSPGGAGKQQIMGRMMAGKNLTPLGSTTPVLNPVPSFGEHSSYESANPKFDAKTKQVFAAVNYGRREAGACTAYGDSHFILHDRLKTDAIFFPEDTFYASGADLQVSYQTFGAIFLKAKEKMRLMLINSCFDNMVLPNTNSAVDLMEAHIFHPVRFADGIAKMVLEQGCSETVIKNAKTFCRRWGIHMIVPGKFEFRGR